MAFSSSSAGFDLEKKALQANVVTGFERF
uniref:Photosystem II protein D1 n=1 Tax=Globodera pallida TaxID=36090 RepID=A0A183CSM8_GLOPA